MRSLNAEVVIFEYYRCFFTPYLLDDKSKNCKEGKHRPEDQLCVKLHVSERFQLLFANGGFAVFRLLPEKPGSKIPALADVPAKLMKTETWQPYINECAKQGEDCGPRLMEMSNTWRNGLKRTAEAKLLQRLAMKAYPQDGFVSLHRARTLDYDDNQAQQAGKYYEEAAARLPNNAVALKEYLMWLDVVAQDQGTIKKLLQGKHPTVRKDKSTRLKLSQINGTEAAAFLCEAATSALQLDLNDMGWKLWNEARRRAPFNKCIKHNWPLIYPNQPTWEEHYTDWKKFEAWLESSVQHDAGVHNSVHVRFAAGAKEFKYFPDKYY